MAWNGNSSRLASTSDDNTVIIWDTASWEPVTTLSEHTDEVLSVAWNGDGSRLASAASDIIIIWEFPDFARLNCRLAWRNLSLSEWEKFLPGVEYRCTCAGWPAGEGALVDAEGCVESDQGTSLEESVEDAMPREAHPAEEVAPTLSAPVPNQAYPAEEAPSTIAAPDPSQAYPGGEATPTISIPNPNQAYPIEETTTVP